MSKLTKRYYHHLTEQIFIKNIKETKHGNSLQTNTDFQCNSNKRSRLI